MSGFNISRNQWVDVLVPVKKYGGFNLPVVFDAVRVDGSTPGGTYTGDVTTTPGITVTYFNDIPPALEDTFLSFRVEVAPGAPLGPGSVLIDGTPASGNGPAYIALNILDTGTVVTTTTLPPERLDLVVTLSQQQPVQTPGSFEKVSYTLQTHQTPYPNSEMIPVQSAKWFINDVYLQDVAVIGNVAQPLVYQPSAAVPSSDPDYPNGVLRVGVEVTYLDGYVSIHEANSILQPVNYIPASTTTTTVQTTTVAPETITVDFSNTVTSSTATTETHTFAVTAATSNKGTPTAYNWTFSGQGSLVGSDPKTVTYSKDGKSYSATLAVTFSNGTTRSATKNFNTTASSTTTNNLAVIKTIQGVMDNLDTATRFRYEANPIAGNYTEATSSLLGSLSSRTIETTFIFAPYTIPTNYALSGVQLIVPVIGTAPLFVSDQATLDSLYSNQPNSTGVDIFKVGNPTNTPIPLDTTWHPTLTKVGTMPFKAGSTTTGNIPGSLGTFTVALPLTTGDLSAGAALSILLGGNTFGSTTSQYRALLNLPYGRQDSGLKVDVGNMKLQVALTYIGGTGPGNSTGPVVSPA